MSAAAGAQVASSRHAILLILTAIMPTMGIVALVPVLPLLLREFASAPGSEVLVPVALTIPALCIAVFSPVAGALSDRLGRKPVLLVSMLVYGVVGALPLLLNDLIAIIAARAVLGLAEAAIMTVSTAMLGDYFDDARRERWISAQMASVSLSAILLVAIGGALGEALGSRGPFLLYLVALPIAIAVAAILFEPVHRAARAEPKARLPLGTLLPVLLITLGVGVLFYTIIVQVGPIVARSGVTSPALIGIAAAGTNLGVAIGSILFGRLKAHAGLQLLALGLALVALGYAGTALAPGLPRDHRLRDPRLYRQRPDAAQHARLADASPARRRARVRHRRVDGRLLPRPVCGAADRHASDARHGRPVPNPAALYRAGAGGGDSRPDSQ